MQSFYGGRQGISFILKKYFSSVDEMNAFFAKGAETTSEVGYGEYVVINTAYTRDSSNGNVYRRGYEGAEGPVCNILGPSGNVPVVKVESADEVRREYLKYNTDNPTAATDFPDTWAKGETYGDGEWSVSGGDSVIVYQLKADPASTISMSAYNELSDYGQEDFYESDSYGYIKSYYYLMHINGVSTITSIDYMELDDEDKIKYYKCYINSDGNIINELQYNQIADAIEKASYKLYCDSDPTDVITGTVYEALSDTDKAKYEMCYVKKTDGTSYLSQSQYNQLTSEEQDAYVVFVTIYYLKDDSTKTISVYAYDKLTKKGKYDYVAVEVVYGSGLYEPNTDSDSTIQYAYMNVLDSYGNVQSCKIGFRFPYTEMKFYYNIVSPYKSNGKRYSSDDEFAMTIHNGKDFNYYKEWLLSVPEGVQGDSVTAIFVQIATIAKGTYAKNLPAYQFTEDTPITEFVLKADGTPQLAAATVNGTRYTVELSAIDFASEDYYYWAEITDYSESATGTKTYYKIGKYQTIKRVTVAETNDGDGKYHIHDLLILYTDESMLGDITYDGVTGWVNAGNTRGKVQGLRIFAVYDSVAAFTAAAGTKDPQTLATESGITDPENVDGWGVIAINGTDSDGNQIASLYYYDYISKKWKKVTDHLGIGVGDPEEVLYFTGESDESDAEEALAEDGYWVITDTIKIAY